MTTAAFFDWFKCALRFVACFIIIHNDFSRKDELKFLFEKKCVMQF